MIVNSNIPSITGNRVLNSRQDEVVSSFNKISSGDAIYSAKFNPLSFGVSEKMKSQIKGIEAAYRNTMDGLSMIQTADGYLNEMSNLISSFRALAVQSANGVYSDAERAISQTSANQLVNEIERVATYANFNGQALFDGRFAQPTADVTPISSLWFQVGENSQRDSNSIRVYINTFNTASLSLADVSLSSPQKAMDTIERAESALSSLTRTRSMLGSQQVRLESVSKTNQVALENFKAAQSVIRDADIAGEVTKLTRNLVQNQVNLAMISQANAQLQTVLRLMG